MSGYDHSTNSRDYPPSNFDTPGSGKGLFWVLFGVAGLGLLILLGTFSGGPTTTEHPGGAGAEPVIVTPTELDPATSGTLVE